MPTSRTSPAEEAVPKVPEAYLEARRSAILEAARRAFTRKGTQTTTMVEIAEEDLS